MLTGVPREAYAAAARAIHERLTGPHECMFGPSSDERRNAELAVDAVWPLAYGQGRNDEARGEDLPDWGRPCPGCGRDMARHLLACKRCWPRLPVEIRAALGDVEQADESATRRSVRAALNWFRDNPVRR